MPTDTVSDLSIVGTDPTSAITPAIEEASDRHTHARRTLRLGIGVTITFVIALLYDWPLSYLAPIFVAPMLQAPAGPSLGAAARILLATFAVSLACLYAASFSQVYPAFFLIALFPLMFWTFRLGLRGGPVLIMLVALCGLMLFPMAANTTAEVTREIAQSFVQNIGLSLLVAIVMYAILPPLPSEPKQEPKPVLPPAEVTRRAALLTAITWSYAVLYFSFSWSNVHTPLYIAVFAFSLDLSRGSTAAKGILAANIAAGVLAMVLYQLTRMTPYLPFVVAMMLMVNLVIARMVTSKAAWAPLAGFALSVLMILYGGSILPFGDDGGSNFADRFGELALAAIWAVGALYVLDVFFPRKVSEAEMPEGLH